MDAETATQSAPTAADEEEPLFSNLDLFLFSLIIGLVVYWFMSRKKPEPIPEFKKLDTPWVSAATLHLHVNILAEMKALYLVAPVLRDSDSDFFLIPSK